MGNTINNTAVIFMADGFEEIEAVTVIDVLRRAEIPVYIVSVTGKAKVEGSRGVRLMCDRLFDGSDEIIDNAAILILPGGAKGTDGLKGHKGLSEALKKANAEKRLIAAICAAPSVLGSLGILRGREAVCYPGVENELTGAILRDTPVVVSDNVITAKAAGAASAFSFKLTELLADMSGKDGKSIAEGIKSQMFY